MAYCPVSGMDTWTMRQTASAESDSAMMFRIARKTLLEPRRRYTTNVKMPSPAMQRLPTSEKELMTNWM